MKIRSLQNLPSYVQLASRYLPISQTTDERFAQWARALPLHQLREELHGLERFLMTPDALALPSADYETVLHRRMLLQVEAVSRAETVPATVPVGETASAANRPF